MRHRVLKGLALSIFALSLLFSQGGIVPGNVSSGSFDASIRVYDPEGAAYESPAPSPSPTPTPAPIPDAVWLRQFGTNGADNAWSIAADASDNLYVTGTTTGIFPGQDATVGGNIFLRKYDISGNSIWTRQFGSGGPDGAMVGVDKLGNVYLAGTISGALAGPSAGLRDAFLRKYDSSGHSLWTRQLGSNKDDWAYGVAADVAGNIYVAGFTDGALPSHTSAGMKDAFVAKYDATGSMLWSKQFGSDKDDRAIGVATDASGNAYVVGHTDGPILPSVTPLGNRDAFIIKFDPSGNVVWARPIGSDRFDRAFNVAVDASGNACVSGYTDGTLPGQSLVGGYDAYIARFDPSGNMVWARQYGSELYDHGYGVTMDAASNIYVVGDTDGALPGQANAGVRDAIAVKYDSNGNMVWRRQFGSGLYDNAQGVAVDSSGNAYVAGSTNGALPGYASTSGGAFIVKFAPAATAPIPSPTPAPSPAPTPTPQPTGTPGATSVELASASLRVASGADIQVWAKNIRDPYGLGAYDFKVSFDRTKIRINDVSGGAAPFSGVTSNAVSPGPSAANNTGTLAFNWFVPSIPGPTGNIHLATINLTALAPGVHPLTLHIITLSSSLGNSIPATTVNGSISVSDSIAVDFTADKTLGVAPLTVNFTDRTLNNPTVWQWDLNGDGTVDSTSNNPSFRYARPGKYTVSLKASNASSTDTKTKTSYVSVERLKIRKSVTAVPDADGVIVLSISVNDVTNPVTGERVTLANGISAFEGEANFSGGGMVLLTGREGTPGLRVFAAPSAGGGASFNGSSTGPYVFSSQTTVAKLVPSLTGSKDSPVGITITMPSIIGGNDEIMEDEGPTTLTFRRGAVRGAATATITDALFIAQYLAALKDISQINALNAASIFHDGPGGDKITIVDALALAQQLAGLRDANFDFIT